MTPEAELHAVAPAGGVSGRPLADAGGLMVLWIDENMTCLCLNHQRRHEGLQTFESGIVARVRHKPESCMMLFMVFVLLKLHLLISDYDGKISQH